MRKSNPIKYRNYTISRTGYFGGVAYEYVPDDYDGPEDKRIGHARTIEDARAYIDADIEFLEFKRKGRER